MKTMLRAAIALAMGFALLLPEIATSSANAQGYKKRGGPARVYTAPRGHRGGYVGPRRRGPSGGAIAAGAAAAIIGGIIVNEAVRSSRRPAYVYESDGLSCYQLERRCDAGHDWACRRLDHDPSC